MKSPLSIYAESTFLSQRLFQTSKLIVTFFFKWSMQIISKLILKEEKVRQIEIKSLSHAVTRDSEPECRVLVFSGQN